jgi:hypothetical protein
MGFAINQGELNAPWAVTVAPATFGIFGGALLVGNFGEGNPSIHAYNPTTGAFLGTLQDEGGTGIVIDKLWDLKFGNGGTGGDPNVLYFAAGPAAEEHGLFGSLSPTTVEAPALVRFLSATYSVVEPLGPININVIRSGDLSGTTTVNFSALTESSAGHAGAGDFTLNPGSVTFAPGEFIKTFPVAITPDALVEGQETLQLVLSNPTGAGLSSPNIARLTIADLTTAAGVSVSGRVLTPGGQGLRNAVVTLTDSQGEARSVTTGSFGYFRFEDVEVGHTYAIAVQSKRFRFATRSVNVVDELTDVDFVGLE